MRIKLKKILKITLPLLGIIGLSAITAPIIVSCSNSNSDNNQNNNSDKPTEEQIQNNFQSDIIAKCMPVVVESNVDAVYEKIKDIKQIDGNYTGDIFTGASTGTIQKIDDSWTIKAGTFVKVWKFKSIEKTNDINVPFKIKGLYELQYMDNGKVVTQKFNDIDLDCPNATLNPNSASYYAPKYGILTPQWSYDIFKSLL